MELAAFIQQFTTARVIELRDVIKQDPEYFLVTPELRQLHRGIGRKAVYYGTYLGRALIDRFIPSLFLLDALAAAPDVRKAVVSAKAEWLFITGKNVLGSSIIRMAESPVPGAAVIVTNSQGDALGWGILDKDPTGKERCIIQRRFDIGDFLRRERKTPKR
jgi:ribosome biogenesis protein Nip4